MDKPSQDELLVACQRGNRDAFRKLFEQYQPILLETSKEVDDELPEIRKILSDVFAKYNLIEPFERVKLACEQVHAQKIGESQK